MEHLKRKLETSGSQYVLRNKCLIVYEATSCKGVNPLSQEEGGGVVVLCIFPHIGFAFLLGLLFGQLTYPLSRYPCFY